MTRKLLPLLLLLALLTGCAAPAFEGSKVTNEDGFTLSDSILNQQEEAVLSLHAGDALEVELAHAAGNVDLLVSQDGAEPIYRGTAQTNASFTLSIPQDGDYRIGVTGHSARGSVILRIVSAVDRH